MLGTPVDKTRPRFDVHTAGSGTPFAKSFEEMPEILCTAGGSYVYVGQPDPRLGKPTMMWSPASGGPLNIVLYSFEPPKPGQAKRC